MNRHRQSATWLGAILGSLCAVLVLALAAHASDRGALSQEFHQTYPMTADGRVELDNINGDVHISAWDRDEVRVDAVKYAGTQEKLDEAKIEVDAGKDYVSIRTKYRDHNLTFNHWSHHNPATVEYTLTVPRTARLDEIKLINGALKVSGVAGEVRASSVNGRVEAQNLVGETNLSSVNGRLEASFDQLSGRRVEMTSVNGALELTIPSDSNARIEASAVSGGIENDLGLRAKGHRFVGRDLEGEMGNGSARIKLENVNGRIAIHHARDGRAMSPIKDLTNRKDGEI